MTQDDDWADDADLLEADPPRRRFWSRPPATGPGAPTLDADGLPSSRMRGNEPIIAYVAAAVAVICGVVLVVDRTGKGAPVHPDPIFAALGVAGGIAIAVTVRWHHRLMTAVAALVTGFLLSEAKGPTSLVGLRDVAFFVPALTAMYLYIRQTSSDKARRKAGLDQARGRRAAGKAAQAEGPKAPVGGTGRATGRYTPPKDRTPPKPTGRRR